mmetsp:Transcript_22589/g.68895  ORF Transcript_22589/g.68895 Transcript_22589/m.68895 type:complete len:292 (-) Transcript_22589:528-1403(-)
MKWLRLGTGTRVQRRRAPKAGTLSQRRAKKCGKFGKAGTTKEAGKPKVLRVRAKPDMERKKIVALAKQLSKVADDTGSEEGSDSPVSTMELEDPKQDKLILKLMDATITYGNASIEQPELIEDEPLPLQALDLEQEISDLLSAPNNRMVTRATTKARRSDEDQGATQDDSSGDGGHQLSEADRNSLCVIGKGIKLRVDVPNLPDDAVEGTAEDVDCCLTGDVMLVDGCAVPLTPIPPSAELSAASTDWLNLYTSESATGFGDGEMPQPPTPVCAALIDAFIPPVQAPIHGC